MVAASFHLVANMLLVTVWESVGDRAGLYLLDLGDAEGFDCVVTCPALASMRRINGSP